jgi:hypothetical protein
MDALALVERDLDDADATITLHVGGQTEVTRVRLWHGEVRVAWEPDPNAGGCLLRPALLRRLVALHAEVASSARGVRLRAPGRILVSLSAEHADLVQRLGGPSHVVLQVLLRFTDGRYVGGEEAYFVTERGARAALMRLTVEVRSRSVATNLARGEVIGPSIRV